MNDIAVRQNTGEIAYGLSDMIRLSEMVHKSNLFPAWKTPDAVLTMMMFCQAKQMHPMEAMEQFDCIQGRPAMKSSAMLARFRASGGRVIWTETTDERVSGTFVARDGSEIVVTWDMERARKAGLAGKDVWKQHPQSMLTARCAAQAVRAIAPEVLFGMLTDKEAEELPPLKVAPAQTSPAAHMLPEVPPYTWRDGLRDFVLKAESLGYTGLRDGKNMIDSKVALAVLSATLQVPITKEQGQDANIWIAAAAHLATPNLRPLEPLPNINHAETPHCFVEGCANILTPMQASASVDGYGKPFCFQHQRGRKSLVEIAKETPYPTLTVAEIDAANTDDTDPFEDEEDTHENRNAALSNLGTLAISYELMKADAPKKNQKAILLQIVAEMNGKIGYSIADWQAPTVHEIRKAIAGLPDYAKKAG